MKQTWMSATAVATLIFGCVLVNPAANAQNAKPEIVHDSEYYILATQHGQQWAAEDQDLNRKLAELRQKYGTFERTFEAVSLKLEVLCASILHSSPDFGRNC